MKKKTTKNNPWCHPILADIPWSTKNLALLAKIMGGFGDNMVALAMPEKVGFLEAAAIVLALKESEGEDRN